MGDRGLDSGRLESTSGGMSEVAEDGGSSGALKDPKHYLIPLIYFL